MKIVNRTKLMAVLLTGTLLGLGSLSANAAAVGTTAGTNISNIATVDYKVGTVSQTTIGSSPTGNTTGAGTATTFKVDAVLILTVVRGDTVLVNTQPGNLKAITTFTVTNAGNQTQDAILSGINMPTGTYANLFSSTTSTIAVTSVGVTSDAAGATPITAISSLAAGASQTVYVVAAIPASAVNGNIAVVGLLAKVGTAGSGTFLTSDDHAAAWTPGTVQNIFGDAATTNLATGDAGAFDGAASDLDGYVVKSASLSVAKTSAVLSDPTNVSPSSGHPAHAIPGAVVQYTITVVNNATSTGDTASSVTLTDDLSTMAGATGPLDDSLTAASMTLVYGPSTGRTTVANCTSSSGPCTFASDVAKATVPSIAAGETATLTFNVTIK